MDKTYSSKLWLPYIGVALTAIAGIWIYQKVLKILIFKDKRHEYFSKVMSEFFNTYHKKTKPLKEKLFLPLQTTKSKIPSLANEGKIRILDLGAGTGPNVIHYPSHAKVVALDPNPYMEKYFRQSMQNDCCATLEKYLSETGENMKSIESESVDAVIVTIVLCSVKSQMAVYEEIKRILVPGGKFYYIEHVWDKPWTFRNMIQQILTKSGLWHVLLDGCNLNRNTDLEILKAGFSDVKQERINLDTKGMNLSEKIVFKIIAPHAVGVATK